MFCLTDCMRRWFLAAIDLLEELRDAALNGASTDTCRINPILGLGSTNDRADEDGLKIYDQIPGPVKSPLAFSPGAGEAGGVLRSKRPGCTISSESVTACCVKPACKDCVCKFYPGTNLGYGEPYRREADAVWYLCPARSKDKQRQEASIHNAFSRVRTASENRRVTLFSDSTSRSTTISLEVQSPYGRHTRDGGCCLRGCSSGCATAVSARKSSSTRNLSPGWYDRNKICRPGMAS